jgi:hypothetical protein
MLPASARPPLLSSVPWSIAVIGQRNPDKETTMNIDFRQAEERETTLARRAATALMCAIAAGVLWAGVALHDDGGLVKEATAAQADAGDVAGYLPAHFDVSGMPVEEPIAQF